MRIVQSPLLRYWSDAALNLVGILGPAAVAIAAIPIILSALTTRDFATLSLQLAVLAVVGINDIGISRSLILIGADGAAKRDDRAYTLLLEVGVRLALYLAGAVTVAGVIVIGLVSLVQPGAQLATNGVSWAILLGSIILSLPAASLRAGLELRQRFGAVAVVRLVGNSTMYAMPAAAALEWRSLLAASLALFASRALFLLMVWVPQVRRFVWTSAFDAHVRAYLQHQLLKRGWWIGVTGVLSNMIAYVDRFALGIWSTAAATASYAVASDLLSKQWLLTGSLITVATPRLAASWIVGESAHARRSFRFLMLSLLTVAILSHLVFSFAGRPLLNMWLGARFTPEIYMVSAVMSLGMAVNTIGAPHFLLINVGKRDAHGAALQVGSLAIFSAATALAAAGGAVAVAVVFSIRLVIDAFVVRSMIRDHPDGTSIGLTYFQMIALLGLAIIISAAGWWYNLPG